MDKATLATEMLRELKSSARRWFVAFCIMTGLELATLVGFIWYLSIPVGAEQVSIENDGGNANYIEQSTVRDINNGENNDKENKASSEK